MIKTIIMALLIFAGMVAYDSATSKPTPTAPPTKQEQQQQEKINKHELSRNIFSNRHDGADSENRLPPPP